MTISETADDRGGRDFGSLGVGPPLEEVRVEDGGWMMLADVDGRQRLRVPALWCPVPEALHPAWRQMQADAVAWMHRYGLASDRAQADRFAAIGAGELGARVTAGAVDVEHAQLAADHLLWLFAFDDTFCDEGAYRHDPGRMTFLVADLLRAAETGRARSSMPLMVALADLRGRIDGGLGSQVQAARWAHGLHAYLLYQVWEASRRAAGTIPNLDSYLIARIFNGSMPVCTAILDISNGYEVPGQEMHVPAVRALSEMCCALVGYDNDIMSYWKETLLSGDGINLIDVLARQRRRTSSQVLAEAVALRDRVLAQFLRLRDQTLPAVTEPTRRYIGDLAAWVRGNLDWGMNSHRYLNPDNPAYLPPSAVAATPTSIDTAPVPALAHWWTTPTPHQPTTRGVGRTKGHA